MKRRLVPVLILVCVVLAGGWTVVQLWPTGPDHSVGGESPGSEPPQIRRIVTLPHAKVLAAGIETCSVERRMVGRKRMVPGRVRYDDTRHVAVKASTDGILHEVLVKPGDEVKEGQVLAIVSSPEVGNARADVLRRMHDLELFQRRYEWERDTFEGLKTLLARVRSGEKIEDISKELQDISIGSYREKVVAAYARCALAETLAENVTSASEAGAVSASTLQQRLSERDAADAALKATMEQSLFDASQKYLSADHDVADARRRLFIAQQQVQTLLGYPEDVTEASPNRPLSHVEVRAPFAGTIEEKKFSASERIDPTSSLFVLADTSQLWVAAAIREQEWSALSLRAGQQVRVRSPALEGRSLTATVYYIGREVSTSTNAVPLVATIDNSDGLLRPGQFVEVELPLGGEHSALAVPSSAIVEHEGQPFLFVPEGERSYRRVDVHMGVTDDDWVEITTGLTSDQQVVMQGAFALKSELLLEGESE